MVPLERKLALMQAVHDGRKASKRHKAAYDWNSVVPESEDWDWINYEYRLEPDPILPALDRDDFWISVREKGGVRNLSVWYSLSDAQKYSETDPIIHVSKVDVILPPEKGNSNDDK